jgi:hypothetical protein
LIANTFVQHPRDRSLEMAEFFKSYKNDFIYHDILIFNDFALHNFSILFFLQSSFFFLISFQENFLQKRNFLNFLEFYFRSRRIASLEKTTFPNLVNIDSKITSSINLKTSNFRRLLFLFQLRYPISHELLIFWVSSGYLFKNRVDILLFYQSFRF